MSIEAIEVGDLIYDPIGRDVGLILGKTFESFEIWWPFGGLLPTEVTTKEKHTHFVYHPEFDKDYVGYCLANDKEKYYENW